MSRAATDHQDAGAQCRNHNKHNSQSSHREEERGPAKNKMLLTRTPMWSSREKRRRLLHLPPFVRMEPQDQLSFAFGKPPANLLKKHHAWTGNIQFLYAPLLPGRAPTLIPDPNACTLSPHPPPAPLATRQGAYGRVIGVGASSGSRRR